MTDKIEDLVEFFDARDQFLGISNYDLRRNLIEGLRRLKTCRHVNEEILFIRSVFDGVDESLLVPKEAKRLLLLHRDNHIALYYAAYLTDYEDDELLDKAAKLGNFLAQTYFAFKSESEVSFNWAKKASGDREALSFLGYYYETGKNCEKNIPMAIDFYKKSSDLGFGYGTAKYGLLKFEKNDPERYLWLGKAVKQDSIGSVGFFLDEMVEQLKYYDFLGANDGSSPVLFMIGKMISGNVNKADNSIFGAHFDEGDSVFESVDRVIEIYHNSFTRAKDAVMCWMIIAKRKRLCRDVARLIGYQVWDYRVNWCVCHN